MTIHHPMPAAPATELAIRPGQTRWDKYQLAGLRALGVENAPNAELAVFFHYCQAHGLDPWSKHVTMIKYGDKWTIQTEIDGFRYIGNREANKRGLKYGIAAAVYYDTDGNRTPYWVRPQEPPGMVEVTIVIDGAPFAGQAAYHEFVKLHPKTGEPMGLWAKMPANQTRKCAEAQAWRMAFPATFADVAVDIPIQTTPAPAGWHEAAVASPHGRYAEMVSAELTRLGIEDDDERLNLVAALAGTDTILDSYADLPDEDLRVISRMLQACEDVGQIHRMIDHGDKP
jgi:hypothetical protein